MHAVVRTYTGAGAGALLDLIESRKDEVEQTLRDVTGFASWSAVRTDDGCVTVTVCQDKAGADESIQVAREWIAANGADLGVSPPSVSEGPVALHFR